MKKQPETLAEFFAGKPEFGCKWIVVLMIGLGILLLVERIIGG